MKNFSLTVSCIGVVLSLAGPALAQAPESKVDASFAVDALQESVKSIASSWAKELDRVAYALEDQALAESGGDALVQSLLARAAHLRAQREQLQQCAEERPSELARRLRASVESTPEALPIERNHVIAALNGGEKRAAR